MIVQSTYLNIRAIDVVKQNLAIARSSRNVVTVGIPRPGNVFYLEGISLCCCNVLGSGRCIANVIFLDASVVVINTKRSKDLVPSKDYVSSGGVDV